MFAKIWKRSNKVVTARIPEDVYSTLRNSGINVSSEIRIHLMRMAEKMDSMQSKVAKRNRPLQGQQKI